MWYSLCKDIFLLTRRFLNKRKRKLPQSEIVQLRQKWKNEFEQKILEARVAKTGRDVIIRDVKRVNSYPDGNDKKGVSSWFKAGLVSTYHRGIQVVVNIGKLTKDSKSGKWRYTNYKLGETGELKVSLIGFIPYENIEAVDWDGNEYHYIPHIYCHFTEKSAMPYEKVAFCEEKYLDDTPYYTEVADFNSVHKLSKKFNVRYFA